MFRWCSFSPASPGAAIIFLSLFTHKHTLIYIYRLRDSFGAVYSGFQSTVVTGFSPVLLAMAGHGCGVQCCNPCAHRQLDSFTVVFNTSSLSAISKKITLTPVVRAGKSAADRHR